MSDKKPVLQISVVMAVYNGERYIADALDTILNQTYPVFEIVVMDDGSTDQTAAVIQSYGAPVIYISKPHSGIADTWNQGVAQAQGDYITFLDADDLWVENKLAQQVAALRAIGVDMVFGHVKQFVSPDLSDDDQSKLLAPPKPMAGYIAGTILTRKETMLQVGSFSTTYRVGEFIDWYVRARNLGFEALMMPDVLLYRRLHKTNTTRQANKMRRDYLYVVKANLDRRRTKKQNKQI